MPRYTPLPVLFALPVLATVAAVGLGHVAYAADPAPAPSVPAHPVKMKMNEPMSTGMMKKGMTKGDVKRAAEKKAKAMRPTMEREQEAMPRDQARP